MIEMGVVWYILKVLFMFSLSFPLLYLVMWLEDKRKARIARKYYERQQRNYEAWQAYYAERAGCNAEGRPIRRD